MCVSSSTKSLVDSYLCVCNGSTSGRTVNGAHQMCVCSCSCKIKCGYECVYMCVSSSLSREQLLVCVCICSYTNTAERLRLHKAVILLFIIKYFVLKIALYYHTTTPDNLLCSPHKDMPIIILLSMIREE